MKLVDLFFARAHARGGSCRRMNEHDMNFNNDRNRSGRFPLDDDDKAMTEQIASLIRNRLSTMMPSDIRSAATVIFALERLPSTTPGLQATFTFTQPDVDGNPGNHGWVDIEISEEEFLLGHGEQFYSPAVGGDTETRTLFETQAGTDWREGNIYDWLRVARIIAAEGSVYCEVDSDFNEVNLCADG